MYKKTVQALGARTVLKGDKKGGYFEANSNVLVAVLPGFDFEVIVTLATHHVPGANPVTVTGLLAAEEDKFVVNTTAVSSDFFFTETSMVTPDAGKVDVILALINTEVPTTGNMVL
jgi:hypothetical protein